MRYYITAKVRMSARADNEVEAEANVRQSLFGMDGDRLEVEGFDIVAISEEPKE